MRGISRPVWRLSTLKPLPYRSGRGMLRAQGENAGMSKLSRRASRLAKRSTQSGFDAAVTIAARAPGLMHPSGDNTREAARMVEEKFAAAYEGAIGATLA